jgi:hypothetical protein
MAKTKPTRKCFLVYGPESSGTRVMTNLLVNWGCAGEGGHSQLIDSDVWWRAVKDKPDYLVWRRSFPHGGIWPEPSMMIRRLSDHGYQPHFVITLRSKTPCVESQVKVGHVRSHKEGEFKLLQAMCQITAFAISFGVPWSMVTYEGLIYSQKLRRALCKELGLKWQDMEFRDENSKHLV